MKKITYILLSLAFTTTFAQESRNVFWTQKIFTQATLWGCLCTILLLGSCLYEPPVVEPNKITVNEEGVVISKLPVWEKDISESRYVYAAVTPIFHDNKVIVAGSLPDGGGMLIALDLESGEEVWRWNDYVDGYDFSEVLSREQLNSKGNLVIYNDDNRFCAVNLDNGTTIWKDIRNGSSHSDAI